MARAKRTDRAAARRRYRAELQGEDELTTATDGATSAGTAAVKTAAPRGGTPAAPARIGIGTAFRLAFRPLDLRGDLAALPRIAIQSKALWLPTLLVIASTIAFAVTGGKDLITQFMFAYFVQTPAIGGVFLAGFLAPRASWLLGAIVGLVSAACYSALILTYVPATSSSGATTTTDSASQVILGAFLMSPVLGAFFAAAAAWYRRFLAITNPNRARANASKAQKADGRSRTAGTQKAGTARR